MSRVIVALGGNLDRPAARLLKVMAELDDLPRTQLLRVSSLYRTSRWATPTNPTSSTPLP